MKHSQRARKDSSVIAHLSREERKYEYQMRPAEVSLRFCFSSDHFPPQECSLSPLETIIYPPQCYHCRAECAVENSQA